MPIPHYLRRASAGLALTGLIFLVLPPILRVLDPSAGSFGIEILNALGLAAMLFGAVVHLALFAYEKFLGPFYRYQAESLDGEGKLFENLTDALEQGLVKLAATALPMHSVEIQIETRKTAQLKFLIRCVRLSFCLLSLAYLLHLAMQVVTVSMTVMPSSAPASSLKPTNSWASESVDSTVARTSKPSSAKPVGALATPGALGPLWSFFAGPDSSCRASAPLVPGLTRPIPPGAMASNSPVGPRRSPATCSASRGVGPLSATSKP
jgi:hypothetical protein